MKISHVLGVLIILVWLSGSAAAAETVTSARNEVPSVQLVNDSQGPRVRVGTEEFPITANRVVVGGAAWSLNHAGNIVITPQESATTVLVPAIAGWGAQIPPNNSAVFEIDQKQSRVAVTAPDSNLRPIFLTCDTGGQIELRAGATGSLEFFANASYMFRGTGDFDAINDDGKIIPLASPGMTMSGGPVKADAEKNPTGSVSRSSPTVDVKITGSSTDRVKIEAGDQSFELVEGVPQTLNVVGVGSQVAFELQPDVGGLAINVAKGDFRVAVDGIPGWNAQLGSSQQGTLTWDIEGRSVEIATESDIPIIVHLPAQKMAEVSKSAILHYAARPFRNFAIVSAGGDVNVYSANQKSAVNLQSGSQILSTVPVRRRGTDMGLPLNLNWDAGGPLVVSSAAAYAKLDPENSQAVAFSSGAKAQLDYSEGGVLKVEAVGHNFELKIDALDGLKIQLEDGDNVTLSLNRRKGTFTVTAGPENLFDTNVDTGNGFAPFLQAGRALNFQVKQDGTMIASAQGQLMFISGPKTPSPLRGSNVTPNQDRIDQLPVSLAR